MTPLDTLFRLEMEFHRRLRSQAPGTADAAVLHTSYALQSDYEALIRQIGPATSPVIERVKDSLALAADARELLAARDSLKQLLGIPLLGF